MKKLISMMIIMGLLLAVGQAFAGGSGGSGKGGFGELGDGCVTFVSPDGPGTVSADNNKPYCNGSDGQVSIPVHLRLDTKKFNKAHRYFWVQGECLDSSLDDEATIECAKLRAGMDGLRMNVYVVDDSRVDLNWQEEMAPLEEREARMGIKTENGHLYFDPLDCWEVPWEPVYVRCDDDKNGDLLCDQWTISTDPDFPTIANKGVFDNASSACFKSGAYGSFYSVVEANFTMEVCVMGVSCPEPPPE